MKKAVYVVLSALLNLTSRLPFGALYLISDGLYAILYHIVRYRRSTVAKNLAESFPEKTADEIKKIQRKFYRNFTDYIVETIKLLHISDEEMKRRMVFVDAGIADDIMSSGQSVAVYFSHCFNWEWAPSTVLWSKFCNANDPAACKPGEPQAAFCQVYRPLKDKWFDAEMLRVRERFHSISIPKAQTLRKLLTLRRDGIPSITGFMADQKPSHGDPTYVTMFLNHPTAMITGTETLARRLGMAAIYWDMEKTSRGHYKITCRLIGRDLSQLPPMGVTDAYARLLEATIRRQPEIWLWTHKRWKIPVKI